MMNNQQELVLDSITSGNCFSICKTSNEASERCAFCPGQYDELERYIPGYKMTYPSIAEQIDTLWTPEVIAEWQQKQSEFLSC